MPTPELKPDDDERIAATAAALEALDMLDEFSIDVFVTARVRANTTIEAVDLEAAAKIVAGWGDAEMDDLDFRFDGTNDIEGDEVAHVSGPPDYEYVEVDLHPAGEPFSWDAVKIVKDLAELDVSDNVKLSELIKQARAACGKKEN